MIPLVPRSVPALTPSLLSDSQPDRDHGAFIMSAAIAPPFPHEGILESESIRREELGSEQLRNEVSCEVEMHSEVIPGPPKPRFHLSLCRLVYSDILLSPSGDSRRRPVKYQPG
jgi:hypothetical protein